MILYNTGESRVSSKIIDEQIKILFKNKIAIDAMHKVKNSALSMKETLLKGDLDVFGKIFEQSWKNKQMMSKKITALTSKIYLKLHLKLGQFQVKFLLVEEDS